MERRMREESVEARKISAQRISKYFSEVHFKSDDFGMLSLVKFQTPDETSHRCKINGLCIAVICSGSVKAVVNGRACELRSNSMLLLNEATEISSLKCSKASMGYYVSFSYPFIKKSILNVSDSMALQLMCNMNPCISASDADIEPLHRMAGMLSDLVSTSSDKYAYNEKIVMSLFTSLFYLFMSILKQNADAIINEKPLNRSDKMLQSFVELLSQECESERSVEYYAKRLNITPKYLSLICKNKMGRNASDVIDEAVIRKAKELLMQSGLTINQVAERLNFVSQSFFGKYFKQRVGMSPSRYKSIGV